MDLCGNRIGLIKYHIHSNNKHILAEDVISDKIESMHEIILNKFANFNAKNIKYVFDRVIQLDLQSNKHTPLRDGTYVKLPKYITAKKCCINVNNTKTNKFKCEKQENLRCFEYALESILNPVNDYVDRPFKYDISRYENLEMKYPEQIVRENMKKYEDFLNIAINVYRVDENDGKTISQVTVSDNYQNRKCIHLLMYKEHVVGIKNISALLREQIIKRHRKYYICKKCNDSFEKEEKYKDHVDLCIYEKQKIEIPKKLDRCYYSIYAEQYHSYIISSDFEVPLHKSIMKNVIHKYQSNSFCFDTIDEIKLINNGNVEKLMNEFNNFIAEYAKRYYKLRKVNIPIAMRKEDIDNFRKATKCYICDAEFINDEEKVRDYDHYTGCYRGAAPFFSFNLHNKCNLKLKLPNFIPILFHNLKYDFKLFLRWILKLGITYAKKNKKAINIISNTKEHYITMSIKIVVDTYKQQYDIPKCKECGNIQDVP